MLNLPTTETTEGKLSFIFVAGSEFTLHKNTLKLFSGNVTHDD
jgi:hypothetical protein